MRTSPDSYADDRDLNDEMRDVERWNDPAAAFLTVSAESVARTDQSRI